MSAYTSIYTLDQADDYFETHSFAHLWQEFDIEVRENNLFHAERTIWRYLGGGELEAVSEYSGDEIYREDYAVFEQALSQALRSMDANASRSGVKVLGSDESIEEELEGGGYIATEAINWLQENSGQLTIARG